MYEIPDNPEIRMTEIHGYPEPRDHPICPSCQNEMGKDAWELDGVEICSECLQTFKDDMSLEEYARWMGIPHRKVGE